MQGSPPVVRSEWERESRVGGQNPLPSLPLVQNPKKGSECKQNRRNMRHRCPQARGRPCGHCGRRGHKPQACWFQQQPAARAGAPPAYRFRHAHGYQPAGGKGKGRGHGKGKGAWRAPRWSPYPRSGKGEGKGRHGPVNIYNYYYMWSHIRNALPVVVSEWITNEMSANERFQKCSTLSECQETWDQEMSEWEM